ncbi:MAG TPA: metallophosphoesterase [Spirochaetia bacterium]|nr:metallophosphoesterase [Spirochaetia bacterium]
MIHYIGMHIGMKVLCIADHVDPVIYSANLKARFADVDLVLSAGDLALEYYDFIVSTLNKPLLFVFGNHHLEGRSDQGHDPFDEAKPSWQKGVGATCLEGKVVRVKGIIIAGLGGSIWYNGGDNQYSDFSMFLVILRLIPRMLWNRVVHGRYLDVLLTHSPPYGINDLPDPCHTGFRVFLWFMRHFHPAYLIHGHVHLYDRNAAREASYAGTIILNAYDHALLNLEVSG